MINIISFLLVIVLCSAQFQQNGLSLFSPPSNLTIVDKDGKPVTTVSIHAFSAIPTLRVRGNGKPYKLSILPSLPTGVVLSDSDDSISGICQVIMSTTEFTVTATNSDGIASIMFMLTSTPCEHGSYTLGHSQTYDYYDLTIKKDGNTVYHVENYRGGDFSLNLCIALNKYDVEFRCISTFEQCTLMFFDDTGMNHLHIIADKDEIVKKELNFLYTTAPTITMAKQEHYVVLGKSLSFHTFINGAYKDVKFTSSEAPELSFDALRQTINGYRWTTGIFSYTITASNKFGKDEKPITVYVNCCKANQNVLIIKRFYQEASDSYRITSTDGKMVIIDQSFSEVNYQQLLCVADGDYHITLKTTKATGSWADFVVLEVFNEEDQLLNSYKLTNNKGSMTDILRMSPYVRLGSLLKFSKSFIASWQTTKFKDSDWKESTTKKWDKWETNKNTVYFRKSINIKNPLNNLELIIDLVLCEGALVYINGNEVIRRNLPNGVITDQTYSTNHTTTEIRYRTTLPPLLFHDGKNVISIEVHRSRETPDSSNISFDLFVSTTFGSSLSRIHPGTATSTEVTPSIQHSPDHAFDSLQYTYWQSTTLPVSLTYRFKDSLSVYVNHIVFQGSIDYLNNQPKKFKIIGIKNDEKEDILAEVDSLTLVKMNQGIYTIPLSSSCSYSAYRFDFMEVNNGTILNVNGISFQVSLNRNCKKFGYGTIPLNQSIEKKCSAFKYGSVHVHCIRDMNNLLIVKDDSECMKKYPIRTESYIDTTFQIMDCTVYRWTSYVLSALQNVITTYLTVKETQIIVSNLKDSSNEKEFSVLVNIRFQMEAEAGDLVMKHMAMLLTNITSHVQKAMKRESIREIVVINGPSFHGQANVLIIVIIIESVMIVGLVVVILLYMRRRTTSAVSVKSLKKQSLNKKGSEKEGLLVEGDV